MAVFAESLEARCQVENEDVVGAAPTGDAPTTSEWSTILLPTKVRLILEILRYSDFNTRRVNSLAPEKFEWNFRYLILQIISVIDGWGISCELALRWMSLDITDDKSTLVQVMAWCCQATSHYLSQCWPRSLSPYGVTGPQWVNFWMSTERLTHWGSRQNGHHFADDIQMTTGLKVATTLEKPPTPTHQHQKVWNFGLETQILTSCTKSMPHNHG